MDPSLLITESGHEGEIHEGDVEPLPHRLRRQRNERAGIEKGRDFGWEEGLENFPQAIRTPKRRLEETIMGGDLTNR